MKLTVDNVTKIFVSCLFTEEEAQYSEITTKALVVEGVNLKVGFHPERIKQNRKNIISMLDCLSDNFKAEKGGGYSFLNMIDDKNGEQWTVIDGVHSEVDKLVTLGLAIGKLSYLMPKEMWKILPGGMPYLVVKNLKMERKEKLKKIEEK